jgi:hypothetical protein
VYEKENKKEYTALTINANWNKKYSLSERPVEKKTDEYDFSIDQ